MRPTLKTAVGTNRRLGWPGLLALVVLAVGLFLAAFSEALSEVQPALLLISGVLAALVIGLGAPQAWANLKRQQRLNALDEIIKTDQAYCLISDTDNRILRVNSAARDRFPIVQNITLGAVLEDVLASADGLIAKLTQKALRQGFAQEVIQSHAEGIRVEMRLAGEGLHLWRVDSNATRDSGDSPTERALISVGRNGTILFQNAAAHALFGRAVSRVEEVFQQETLSDGEICHLRPEVGGARVLLQTKEGSAGRMELELSPIAEPASAHRVTGGGDFATLPVPLLRMAPDGSILEANEETRRMLSLGAEPLPSNVAQIMEGLGRPIADWLQDAAAGRGPNRTEFLRVTRSDREVFVQVTLNRVVENGEASLIAVLNDATELKTLEAQFVQAQKMQAIGQLAGGVAHDFNNLLTAISGHCDLMLLRHDQGDPNYGDLIQINQNANRAAALVGQLLAFSRKQTMRLEVLDLRETLSDLTHLLNRLVGEKVRLVLQHDPELPQVRGDRRQLEQVLMNLVVNARDAMPRGGAIRIETARRELEETLERDRARVPPGVYVSVQIIDEGMGIPADKLEKVFEPFFTTKRTGEGTGLGLSTVYGIVKQTGGFVFVDSVVGQGTQFTLLLPSCEQVAEVLSAPEVPVQRRLPERGTGVVLLVEDEAPVRDFAARALRLRGYTVIEAETGEEALEMLEDEGIQVDIFVTDVIMPGIDGPTWVRQALQKRENVRVVFVSGYAEDAFNDGQNAIPNSVFLPKPFSLSDLTETVHEQLSEAYPAESQTA